MSDKFEHPYPGFNGLRLKEVLPPERFGSLLRTYRVTANATLQDLADVLDLSVPYLSDIERGKRSPKPIVMRLPKVQALLKLSDAQVDTLRTASIREMLEGLDDDALDALESAINIVRGKIPMASSQQARNIGFSGYTLSAIDGLFKNGARIVYAVQTKDGWRITTTLEQP